MGVCQRHFDHGRDVADQLHAGRCSRLLVDQHLFDQAADDLEGLGTGVFLMKRFVKGGYFLAVGFGEIGKEADRARRWL